MIFMAKSLLKEFLLVNYQQQHEPLAFSFPWQKISSFFTQEMPLLRISLLRPTDVTGNLPFFFNKIFKESPANISAISTTAVNSSVRYSIV